MNYSNKNKKPKGSPKVMVGSIWKEHNSSYKVKVVNVGYLRGRNTVNAVSIDNPNKRMEADMDHFLMRYKKYVLIQWTL